MLRILCLVAAAWGAPACSSKSSAVVDGGTVIFPAAFHQAGFRMVRACRAPGEHSALNGFTVWVNDAAAAIYDEILSSGGDVFGQQKLHSIRAEPHPSRSEIGCHQLCAAVPAATV